MNASRLLIIILSMSFLACSHSKRHAAAPLAIRNPLNKHHEDPELQRINIRNQTDALDGIPLSLKLDCAAQICGSPRSGVSASDISAGRIGDNPEVDSFYNSEIRSDIQNIFIIDNKANVLKLTRLEQALPRLSQVQLSKPYTALTNSLWALAQSDSISSAIQGDTGAYTIDDDLLAKSTPQLSAQERAWLKKYILDIYNASQTTLSARIDSLGLNDLIKIMYPDDSASVGRGKLGKAILDGIVTLQGQFPELNLSIPPGVKELADGKDLTTAQISGVKDGLSWSYFSEIATQRADDFAERPVPVAKIVNDASASHVVTQAKQYYSSPPETQRLMGLAMSSCKTKIAQALIAAPTDAELAHFQQLVERVRESVLEISHAMQPTAATDDGETERMKALNAVSFNYPVSRSSLIPSFKSAIEAELADENRLLQAIPQYSDSALFLTLSILQTGQESDATDAVNQICDRFAPTGLLDNSLAALSRINLSWQTVRFPEHGLGIVAHEFGHALSNAFAKGADVDQSTYDSVRTCTNLRHGSLDSAHDRLYIEEDFADVVSAQVVKDLMAKGVPSTNMGCELLGEDDTRWGNYGLSMIIRSSSKDGHSASLYRTIQLQINSGAKLPDACSTIVNQYTPSANQTCL